ncbi:run domain Beclin-1-interacting and cysteine-rich domain-containing protein isoform X4 [Vombatus ursinus]|uniref:run domain Beclin-1-interacting and cysteine-rich domain-containing protein isoform X4 n=1 Tax=Vombatus ursinus TaxID=29139 RepID=UPI000FFD09D0|nr:run domain Beclin-1-interacting and cysteine-rich domain-containing protein isoform X4 [Vombatus ursinus]
MRPEGPGMEISCCGETLQEESRREHWKLLSNLKTTVEGLVSANNPNVWSKYGGLERLCRDMKGILYHGLIHDQVCCQQNDYWQFVKDIRWLSPHSALHVEKFISLYENGQRSPDGVRDQAIAELWLQHSLQFHCLSAQLRPLLGDRQYIRKFYTDAAFLLSSAHVTAMLQCLEAVEQNNPRLLAQIDASMFARKHETPLLMTKSQSLTALPGSSNTPPAKNTQHCYFGSFSGPYQSTPIPITDKRPISFSLSGPPRKPQESKEPIALTGDQSFQGSLPSVVSALARDSPPSPNDMSSSALTSPSEEPWTSSQDDPQNDANDGPEYLAIGNLGSRARAASCQSNSSNSKSSSSNLFSSSSSQKANSPASSVGEQEEVGQSQVPGVLRRSSFSEGQTLAISGGAKKSHTRSHSDTNIASRKVQESRNDSSKLKAPVSSSGRNSEVSISSSLDVEYDADIRRSTSSSNRSHLSSESFSHCFLHSTSAEAVAMGLLKQFEGMQLPAASELEWLVPEHDAPQKLLPIPDSLPISPDDGQHADIYKLRIRVRGNLEWAPPRPQIIFNVHPAPTRKIAVAKQNYRCAGCGTRTDPDYIKRLHYCEYLGKYFCQCCHGNAQAVIPSRILRKWDFSKYYVSNFSKDLLTKIWNDPLFNVQDINSALYRKVKLLNQVRLLRIQLYHMKNMFKTCRLAKDLLDAFDMVPGHLTEDLHLYSLNDLTTTKKGELAPQLSELARAGTTHVQHCMLCQAKGFICEFCQDEDDIIFPFELHKCRTCEECRACYHKACFKSGSCPKCTRLQARRELLAKQSLESCVSDYEEEGTAEAVALEAT